MPFVLTVSIVVFVVMALVGAVGFLIDGSAEPRQQNERRE
jgi:preprotein translocase subunit Sss1